MNTRLLLLSIALISLSLKANNPQGTWKGKLNIQGNTLQLAFNIMSTNKALTGTMDSPDQGAFGIRLSNVKITNEEITLELDAIQMKFAGKFVTPDSISGTFQQMGMSLPLSLVRSTDTTSKPNRPQEPKAPFPYLSEEIKFVNTKAGISLAGTLTMPQKGNQFPAVILISGSGPQNRDEEVFGHKPFAVIADYLTRHGFAVLRFDDRGCFNSEGDFATATTFDFASDVNAAVNYLMNRKEIDKKKIGLIGHSEGGIIAPLVAVENKNVSHIVLLAGTGIKGKEILTMQQELIGRANGISDENIAAALEINRTLFDIIETTPQESLKEKVINYLLEVSRNDSTLQIPDNKTIEEYLAPQVNQITSAWMTTFITHDPAPVLQKVKCPVLAINGSNDLQVPSGINLNAIEAALKAGKNKNFKTIELQGLNHLFQECATGSPNRYATIEQTFAPIALETMLSWLKNLR